MNDTEKEEDQLCEVALDRIQVNPFQPRHIFSPVELEELAASIKIVGIIHPPVVRPSLNPGYYELVSGERRMRAAQLAGFSHIPVIVRHQAVPISAQAALIENIQRVDLNPIEIAKALRKLGEEFGLNQEELAQRVGKKRSTVTNYLRLLSLPSQIQESVSAGLISMGHAKAILSLTEENKQKLLHEWIFRDRLSVRETEAKAQQISNSKSMLLKPRPPSEEEPHLKALERAIQDKLGTKVTLTGKGLEGQIIIDYYGLDDLDRLLSLLDVSVQEVH